MESKNRLAAILPMPQMSKHARFRFIHETAEELLRGDSSLSRHPRKFRRLLNTRLADGGMALNTSVKTIIKLALKTIHELQ